jgi:hypothetical protein
MQTTTQDNTLEMALEPRAAALPPAHSMTRTAPATPADLVLYVMQNGGSVDQLREFMALQREWEAGEARKAYVADMAEFKRNPPTILKDKRVGYENKDGTFTGYKHASLGNVTNAVVEGLARHGFSHNWDVKQDGATAHVTCKITHRMGHSESVSMQANKDDSGKKNAIQQVASAVSYLQRYTLLAATGLATHEDTGDDDGANAEPAPDVAQWCAKADAAPTGKDLAGVWDAGSPKFDAANDMAGRAKFLEAVEARKAAIVGGGASQLKVDPNSTKGGHDSRPPTAGDHIVQG